MVADTITHCIADNPEWVCDRSCPYATLETILTEVSDESNQFKIHALKTTAKISLNFEL